MFKKFVQQFEGPKLDIACFGCGTALAGLLSTPGSSNVVHSIQFINSDEARDRVIDGVPVPADMPAVSEKFIKWINDEILGLYPTLTQDLYITGALITNRYRKGPNHAWIGFFINHTLHTKYIELPKETEAEWERMRDENTLDINRAQQEYIIAEECLKFMKECQ